MIEDKDEFKIAVSEVGTYGVCRFPSSLAQILNVMR